MNERSPQTTEFLQKNFHSVYQEFFSSSDLVISIPLLFNWGQAFSKVLAFSKIKQKLPNKMFLGFKFTKQKKYKISDCKYFSQHKQDFFGIKPEFFITNLDFLEDFLGQKVSEIGFSKGVEIKVLSEYPRGSGVGFTSSLFSGLSAFFEILKTNDFKYLQGSQVFDIYAENIIQNYRELNQKLYRNDDIKLTDIGIRSVLQENYLPFSILNGQYGHLDQLFVDENRVDRLPFDFGIISFGLQYDTNYLLGNQDSTPDFLLNGDTQSLPLLKINASPHFGKTLFSTVVESLQQKLLKARKYILERPFSEASQQYFFDAIAEQGYFSCFLEKDHKLLTDLYFLFDKAKFFNDEKIYLMPISSFKTGGTVLFVTQKQKSRDSIQKLQQLLRKNGYHKSVMNYLSRQDGYSSESMKIEQFISKNIFSKYVSQDNVVFKDFQGKQYVGLHRKILQKEKKYLIFDTVNKKIYLNGEALTHRDLRSQSGTVEIMNILFQNRGIPVQNNEFPSSSYSKNKNEMIGKIISPLQALNKKYFKKNLDIQCNGSLHSFDVFLDSVPQNIGLIKKISL